MKDGLTGAQRRAITLLKTRGVTVIRGVVRIDGMPVDNVSESTRDSLIKKGLVREIREELKLV